MKTLMEDFKPLLIIGIAILLSSTIIALFIKYLLPLVLGAMLALFIDPIVSFFENRFNINRGIVVIIILIIAFILLGFLGTAIVSRFTFELGKFVNSLPKYYHYYSGFFDKITNYFFYFSSKIPIEILPYIKKNFYEILYTMTGLLSNFYSLIMNKIGMLPNLFVKILVFLMFTFLFAYFSSKDKRKIIASMKKALPKSIQEKAKKMQFELLISFIRLIKAQLFMVLVSTIITIIGFYILRIDYALILGIICGVLDILPVVGPSIIFIPWLIACGILGKIDLAIGLLIHYIIIIGSRQFLQAKIIGRNLGIDPFLTLISIYLGVEIFGFSGLFIGPIVIVIIRALIHSGIIPPLYQSDKID